MPVIIFYFEYLVKGYSGQSRQSWPETEALELLGTRLAHLDDAGTRAQVSPRIALLLTTIRDKLARTQGGRSMSSTDSQVSAAASVMEEHRGSGQGEVGAALVVGPSAESAAKEARFRDDMIRIAHRAGVYLRRLAGDDRPTLRQRVVS